MRTKTLKETDFLGEKTYVLADGSKVPSQTFRIRSLKVGDKVLENVNGSVASVQGSLLLGQGFLRRFKSRLRQRTTGRRAADRLHRRQGATWSHLQDGQSIPAEASGGWSTCRSLPSQ